MSETVLKELQRADLPRLANQVIGFEYDESE
jgi:hypothetical protein